MIRRAKDTQMPEGFDVFWGKVYDGGKKKVNNPNPKTRKTHPTISASTAMKYEMFREHVMQQFEDWKDSNKDEKDKSESGKKTERPTKVYEKLVESIDPKLWDKVKTYPLFKDDPHLLFDLCGLSASSDEILGEIVAVNVYFHEDGSLILDVESENIDLIRKIKFSKDTPKFIYNNLFVFKTKKASGAGSSMFSSQVEAAKKAGFKSIDCEAAGWKDNEDGFVGYYVWPILGYDSPLKPVRSSEKRNLEIFCEDNKVEMPKTVQELYSISGGREWWKEFGWGLKEAKFDLSEGSRSLRVLRAYMEAKKTKGGSKKASKKPSKKMPKGWTDAPHIELDEEELNKIFKTKATKTKKKASEGKPSAQFLKFWDEVYDNGKKKVSNPNQATKKTHPNVSASTAMKTPAFQAKVKKEFKAWLQQQDEKSDKKPKPKSEDKEPAQDKPKGRSLANPKRVAEFKKLVSDECKKARENIDKLSEKDIEFEFNARWGEHKGVALTHVMSNMSISDKRDSILFSRVSKIMTKIWLDSCENSSLATELANSWIDSPKNKDCLQVSHLLKKIGFDGSFVSAGEEKTGKMTRRREKELVSFMEDIQSFNQAVFDELGIKELTVFRAVDMGSPPKEGEKTRLQTRGLSSWTISPGLSESYKSESGIVVSTKIPVERVFMSIATFHGGNGSLSAEEYEVSVIGAQELDLDVVSSTASEGKQASNKPKMIPITEDNEDWLRKNRKKNKKKASLSCLVLKVAQLNSHVRKAFLHEIRKATRPMTRSEFQKAQLGTVIEVMPNSKAKEMAKQYGGGDPVPVLYVKVTDGWVKPDGFQPGGQRVVSIRFKKTPLDDSKFDLSLKEDCVFSLGVHELEGWF